MDKDTIRFYKRANYIVIRMIWNLCKARRKDSYTLSDALDINRQRYTRAVQEGSISIGVSEAAALSQRTGLRIEVFEGKDLIQTSINAEQWESLFTYDVDSKQYKEKLKEYQDIISNEIIGGEASEDETIFVYYSTNMIALTSKSTHDKIWDIISYLDKVTFSLLDDATSTDLRDLRDVLNKKRQTAEAILLYRKEKTK